MPIEHDWTRREILKSAAAGTLVSSAALHAAIAREPQPADPERIRRENEHPGTPQWMTTNVRIDPATKYRSPWIEGYASRRPASGPANRSPFTSAPIPPHPSCSRSIASATTRATADA